MASEGAARALSVERGTVLPPELLQALLPDVASVVTKAISGPSKQIFGLRKRKDAKSAQNRTQSVQPAAPESQPQTTDSCKEPRHTRNILNPFPCSVCEQRFPTRQNLNTHWRLLHNQCTFCKTKFKCRGLLLNHLCCKLCKKSFKSKLKHDRHMKRHARPVSLKCAICKLSFSKKTDLIQHKSEMTFGCQTCEKCFQSPEDHVAHSKPSGQSEQSEFLCKHCGECFVESFSFTSHVRSHRGPAKSYSRAPKKPRQHTIDVKSEGVETSKINLEKNVNEVDNHPSKVVKKFKEPSELIYDMKNGANKGFNSDKVRLETITEVEIKKEPDATVWLELELKKEPMEQPNVDEIVEVKKESEWVDVETETGTSDVVVKEELEEL